MITQTMDLIRRLTKMQQKKQLYFAEHFLLYWYKPLYIVSRPRPGTK